MSYHADPVNTFLTARDRLADERRAPTLAIALGYRRRRSDEHQTNSNDRGAVRINVECIS